MRRFALLPLLLTLSLPAAAWEPETRVRMADEALRLMPASLRTVLERNRRPLLRGLLEAQVDEGQPGHRPPWLDGSLDAEVALRAQALVESVRAPKRFDEIARRFGELAHFVMDAGFPPAMSASGERYQHFADFCEARREKFPLVFYGHDRELMRQPDFAAFARSVMQRARDEDGMLGRAYAVAGENPHPGHFDDRSIPFAVGSLAYSHSVTDVVRAWMAAWSEANGDLGRTPYLRRSSAKKGS